MAPSAPPAPVRHKPPAEPRNRRKDPAASDTPPRPRISPGHSRLPGCSSILPRATSTSSIITSALGYIARYFLQVHPPYDAAPPTAATKSRLLRAAPGSQCASNLRLIRVHLEGNSQPAGETDRVLKRAATP